MDFTESTKIVFSRVQKLEPELASKIIGYLLLQDDGEREMIRLAFGPDHLIPSLINKAKADLRTSSKPVVSTPIPPTSMNSVPISEHPLQYTPFSPASSRPFSSPATFRVGAPYWDPQVPTDQQLIHNMDFMPPVYPDQITDDYRIHNPQFLNLEDQIEQANGMGSDFSSNYYYSDPAFGPRTSRRSPSMPEFPVKACHYFNKGFCKHGSNCRYFHAEPIPDGFSQVFNQNSDLGREDYIFSPGSLEKLEVELTELLRSRKGGPVSIAALPLMYYEKYGRALQADGYLTESQRHGKAGYSLTKLLARLKNTIRLIDRPHGQHSVVLAEYAPHYNASNYSAPNYMDYRNERSDPGGIVPGSRQIYLTFPAESTFTEEDVSNYFKSFGPVQDVRIPTQQKRMFGFVTFVYPDTVKTILTKGNPHFVCGARVLVKPYREKTRVVCDRKYADKIEPPMYYQHPHFIDMDSDFQPMRVCDHNSRLLQKQFIEEHEQALEMRLSDLQLSSKPVANRPYFGYSMDEVKFSEGHNELPSADRFSYLFDVLNNGSSNEDKAAKNSTNNFNEQDSGQGINLPESPFASPIASGISTVI